MATASAGHPRTADQGKRRRLSGSRLQLADAREQRQQDRVHADTLEWRERRLAAYDAGSAAIHRLDEAAADSTLSSSFRDPDSKRDARLGAAHDEL
jgi:hypothetical protein